MESGTPPYTIFLKMCTNILHLAPPALPIMTAFCLTTSLARLRLSNIFGVNPNAILNAGRVTTCCFDKTGTLTEFHMDFYQFIISKGKTFQEPIFVKEHKENKDLCKKLFATCHSITTNSKGE
jgi:P-type E1-E2 ATPase